MALGGCGSAKPTPCGRERKGAVAVKLWLSAGCCRDAEHAMEVDDAVQAVKLRYLNAIGIESWVRRSEPLAVSSMPGDAETSAAEETLSDGENTVVEMLADEPVAAVRNLLDANPGAARAAQTPSAAAAHRETVSASAETPAQVTPEFRLLVLHLAGSVLLVDESLLDPGSTRAEQMLLLGDVLRSARLLVHGDASGSIEHQIFYWPQVDDAALDQGLPRAKEALVYHVRMRLEGGSGPVLHVTRGIELEVGSGSAIARDSVAELAVTALEVGAELLAAQASGQVRAQLWAELCTLEEMLIQSS